MESHKDRSFVLKGGRVVDPSQNMDKIADVVVENGLIKAIIPSGIPAGTEKMPAIDVSGLVVTPGLIDMHVHFREPGWEYKETIATGSQAACAGGFTAVACMANTNPINDNRAVTEFIRRKGTECGLIHVYPVASITVNAEGKLLTDIWDLKEAGAVAISDDGRTVRNSALMRRALEYAYSLGIPVISHCEDPDLSEGGVINEGIVSTELGLPGIPPISEDIMVSRDIMIAEYTGTAVHIAHVSTAGAVRLIREAKARDVKVTAETAPHYFTLTHETLYDFDVNAKVNPPLRSKNDLEAIVEGLRDGTIDAIASDHAPHAAIDKEVEFEYAANGIAGLETSLGLSLRLVHRGILTLSQLIAKMSTIPANILKVPGGTLRPGSRADITVIDLNHKWKVEPEKFYSMGRNTPFSSWELKGKAIMTIKEGKVVYHLNR